MITLSLNVCSGCFDQLQKKKIEDPWDGKYNDNSAVAMDVRVPGEVPDYTKRDGTSSMCWAIAVCNALEYAGHIDDNGVCVGDMKSNYGNKPGRISDSYLWYMTDVLLLDPNKFYTREYDHDLVVDFILDSIQLGLPVVWSLPPLDGDVGHALMVYGWTATVHGYVLYVVDGDDHKHTATISLYWDDGWVIHSSGKYNQFEPGYAFSIKSATQ